MELDQNGPRGGASGSGRSGRSTVTAVTIRDLSHAMQIQRAALLAAAGSGEEALAELARAGVCP